MLLVAYGVLSVSEIRKLGWRSQPPSEGARGRAPAASPRAPRPDRRVTCSTTSVTGPGAIVRPLVREGIVPRPDRPSYTIAMLAATRYRDAGRAGRRRPGSPRGRGVAAVRGRGRRRGQPRQPREVLRRHVGRGLPRPRGARSRRTRGRLLDSQPRRTGARLRHVPGRLVLALPRVARTDATTSEPMRVDCVPAASCAAASVRPSRSRSRRSPGSSAPGGCPPTTCSTASGRSCRTRRREPRRPASVSSAERAPRIRTWRGGPRSSRPTALRTPRPTSSERRSSSSARLVAGAGRRGRARGRGSPAGGRGIATIRPRRPCSLG